MEEVECHQNQLTSLPKWPLVKEVCCEENQLTELPCWPLLGKICCEENQLTWLPRWPLAREVDCRQNQLTWLPIYPIINSLDFDNRSFLYSTDEYIDRMPACVALLKYLRRKAVIAKWKRFTRQSVAKKKHDLHNELKYSPDLPFIYRSSEARHWLERVIETGWLKRYLADR